MKFLSLQWPALLLASTAAAVQYEATSADSIKSAAATIAYDLMKYYTGNNTGDNPGNLPWPYYWWEAGAVFGTMVEYYYYTGDTSYNEATTQALTWQAGEAGTFMPANQTRTEGNDDQIFWGLAAMSAAELDYPAPPSPYPSWTAMAQAVFSLQAGRWETSKCGGGLRWQIFYFNNGYNYKNSVANGGFFQIASRLARYTGNDTYTQWADKSWTWFSNSVLYDPVNFKIYDGTSMDENCTIANEQSWSYNYGLWLGGLAYLYNHTQDDKYLTPLKGILNTTLTTFFPEQMGPQIMVEIACEPSGNCDTNGYTFKAFTSRWLGVTTQLVPELADQIWPYLSTSAKGAAGQCSGAQAGAPGAPGGNTCGYEWNSTTWDGATGIGQQMSALSIVQTSILKDANLKPPLTLDTGGTSKDDPNAGSGGEDSTPDGGSPNDVKNRKISTGDKAGAGILTAVCLVFTLGGAGWMIYGGPG
ncbi:glycoside hydrolase family 76 protein [Polychaeton citri CBS 116435]|uniref:Mannan endo-1,6-alpha-mannosidase n=1 Tax=Polychaeton citri CBS 116435 TaxID=1314669 RepID=A0A9P4Q8I5_9PEZI|nr:glycoside hydrolase family 76 protein [Polychaeton citri CBS 116435]